MCGCMAGVRRAQNRTMPWWWRRCALCVGRWVGAGGGGGCRVNYPNMACNFSAGRGRERRSRRPSAGFPRAPGRRGGRFHGVVGKRGRAHHRVCDVAFVHPFLYLFSSKDERVLLRRGLTTRAAHRIASRTPPPPPVSAHVQQKYTHPLPLPRPCWTQAGWGAQENGEGGGGGGEEDGRTGGLSWRVRTPAAANSRRGPESSMT